MTVLALNLKRMVKLLTGVNFKGRARLSAGCRGTSAPDEGRRKEEGAERPDDSPERREIGALKLLPPPQTSPERRSNCLHDETLNSYCPFFHTLLT
jgi:hypothetical protein